MKIKASFEKDSYGSIIASITTIDKEDYVSVNIFNGPKDFPGKEFVLAEAHGNIISNLCTTDKEALKWVDEMIGSLHEHLQVWRGKNVPQDYELSI